MGLHIERGLFSHMVLQRNARGVCDADIGGTSDADGLIEARALRNGKAVAKLNWKSIGEARRGKFCARLSGVPAGGPYDIELRIAGGKPMRIGDVLVGDVWVLAGQSNMQGCGRRRHAAKPHKLVRGFYMDDRWAMARDPMHNLWDAVDAIHRVISPDIANDGLKGVGPGVAFAQEMLRRSGVPQGLIACAHGGTSMAQWDPAKRDAAGGSLYGAMIRRVRKNGGKIAGVLWYQGESDSNRPDTFGYTGDTKKLVAAARREFGAADLPWVIVQLGRFLSTGSGRKWNEVQEQQRRLPEIISRCAIVPAIDLALDDQIHIGGDDVHRLGRRLAQAMCAVLAGKPAAQEKSRAARAMRDSMRMPIELKSMAIEADAPGMCNVIVEFANVEGRLHSPGRPLGFAIAEEAETVFPIIVRLEGSRAILRVRGNPADQKGRMIYYGYGADPICTITDEADRSLPVFGPLPLGRGRALTPFCRTPQMSAPQPPAGKLQSLRYPENLDALNFSPQQFPGGFCDIHLRVPADAARFGGDVLYYFRTLLSCSEKMELVIHFGYDGPVKLWIDGREVFHDPAGTNPANPEKAQIPFSAAEGRHEILIALGSNGGSAWGIFLRLHRKDISARRVAARDYAMPLILT